MKKAEFIRIVARRHSVSPGEAADRIDRHVNRIVRALKRGEHAQLPGLGTLLPGRDWEFRPESEDCGKK